MKPRIVTAANQHEDGTIILGIRHWDSHMHKQVKAMPKHADREDYWIQGFVDQFGTFYTRKEAFILAAKNSQIIRMCGNENGTELYSEHLY